MEGTAMRSMTGFGRAEEYSNELNCGFRVEISSINKKQFELKLNIPRELSPLEIELRTFVAERLARGSISLRVELILHNETQFHSVDFSRAVLLLKAAYKFQQEHGLPGEITISDILAIPDAAVIQNADLAGESVGAFLKEVISAAIDRLVEMREREGENLKQDILTRLADMERSVEEIEPLAAKLPELQAQKLYKRLKELELLPDAGDDRLLREAVIFGDKLDVTEEITSLRSHFANFRNIAEDPVSAIGRSLDFMIQEIFRECNTLGNKAASTEISPKIVILKTELEKIREQVQNIE